MGKVLKKVVVEIEVSENDREDDYPFVYSARVDGVAFSPRGYSETGLWVPLSRSICAILREEFHPIEREREECEDAKARAWWEERQNERLGIKK